MSNYRMTPISDIKEREHSQRDKPRGVSDLAESIKRYGLIHPITVDDDLVLIAGQNRLEAFKLLAEEDKKFLMIPTFIKSELSNDHKKLIELDENTRRTDLTWKENVAAVLNIHKILEELYPKWTMVQQADYAGYNVSWWIDVVNVGHALEADNPLVKDAGNLTVAINALERDRKRRMDDQTNNIFETLTRPKAEPKSVEGSEDAYTKDSSAGDIPQEKSPVSSSAKKSEEDVKVLDFIKWSGTYDGPRFNMLHCDFPYGINHGNSAQGGAKTWGAYDDSPDIYWALLRALAENIDNILLPKSHIIFWFSMKFYRETLEFFEKNLPCCDVDYQPLVWVKSDNKGVIRNVDHTPRNVTETALFITRGKRKIIKAVGNAYHAPTSKSSATHISEKPVPVLRHFMQLCVDGFTEMLDPTCGAGSALRAAESMGAKKVMGIELNEDYANDARKRLTEMRNIEKLKEMTGG